VVVVSIGVGGSVDGVVTVVVGAGERGRSVGSVVVGVVVVVAVVVDAVVVADNRAEAPSPLGASALSTVAVHAASATTPVTRRVFRRNHIDPSPYVAVAVGWRRLAT
jgi:hypothetical protein